MSTRKGKDGEREIVRICQEFGLAAQRTSPLQAASNEGAADVLIDVFPVHLEVKRDERMSVDAMVRQVQRDSPSGDGVVLWRRNKGAWRADIPLPMFLAMVATLDRLGKLHQPSNEERELV